MVGNTYYMARREPKSITEKLKAAIADAIENGESYKSIERETGVLRQSLMKFMKGETSLRLDIADKLADYFELSLQNKKET